jgi:hypothetical protein
LPIGPFLLKKPPILGELAWRGRVDSRAVRNYVPPAVSRNSTIPGDASVSLDPGEKLR